MLLGILLVSAFSLGGTVLISLVDSRASDRVQGLVSG